VFHVACCVLFVCLCVVRVCARMSMRVCCVCECVYECVRVLSVCVVRECACVWVCVRASARAHARLGEMDVWRFGAVANTWRGADRSGPATTSCICGCGGAAACVRRVRRSHHSRRYRMRFVRWPRSRLRTPACALPLAHSRLRHSHLRHSRLRTPTCARMHERAHTRAQSTMLQCARAGTAYTRALLTKRTRCFCNRQDDPIPTGRLASPPAPHPPHPAMLSLLPTPSRSLCPASPLPF
jgi:hypothetical protein